MSPGLFSDVLFINYTNTGQFTDEKQPVIQEWKASWEVDIRSIGHRVKSSSTCFNGLCLICTGPHFNFSTLLVNCKLDVLLNS